MRKLEPDRRQVSFGLLELGDVAAGTQHRPISDRHSFELNQQGATLSTLRRDLAFDVADLSVRHKLRMIEEVFAEES